MLAYEKGEVCGTASHEGEVLKLGKGDRLLGELLLAKKQLALDEAAKKTNQIQIASDLAEVSFEYHRQKEPDLVSAKNFLDRAMVIWNKQPISPELANSLWLAAHNSGGWADKEADVLFKRAVEVAEQLQQKEPDLLPKFTEGYADYLVLVNQPAPAESYYLKSLKARQFMKAQKVQQHENTESDDVYSASLEAEFYEKLAKVQATQHKFEEAASRYKMALAIYRAHVKTNHWLEQRTAKLIQDYAKLLRQMNRIQEAVRLEKEAEMLEGK
jgi:hypothetical protein